MTIKCVSTYYNACAHMRKRKVINKQLVFQVSRKIFNYCYVLSPSSSLYVSYHDCGQWESYPYSASAWHYATHSAKEKCFVASPQYIRIPWESQHDSLQVYSKDQMKTCIGNIIKLPILLFLLHFDMFCKSSFPATWHIVQCISLVIN